MTGHEHGEDAAAPLEEFDYIIVGAGSAGAALAARLTESGTHEVLLLEAGPADKRLEIHVPAAFAKLFRSGIDWDYNTVPQPGLEGRSIYWPRGKVLGGSSSINAMMWVRGFAADYDDWADAAGPDWSWHALQPYFARVERIDGSSGAVSIQAQRSPRSHTAVFLKAAEEIGLPVVPANHDEPEGVTQTLVTQRRGARVSTADAYLKPARGRRNLTVRTGAHTTRVLFDGQEATGVEYVTAGIRHEVHARKEVVLCGGAVNTPQLLMLSGIGDRYELASHGIETLVHSPEVGKNLRDHLAAGLIVDAERDTLFTAQTLGQLARYLTRRTGMLTSNVAEAYGFVKTDPALALPDIELMFAPVPFVNEGLVPPTEHGLTIGVILLKPKSTGCIALASADPFAKPLIDPKYLSDPDGTDRATMLAGLTVCEKIIATAAIGSVSKRRFLVPPGVQGLPPAERDALSLTELSHTMYHPVGTARMGQDAASVVDPALRVRGVNRLRVADASVMPEIIRGHTNAPAIVIGEKAADLLLADACQ